MKKFLNLLFLLLLLPLTFVSCASGPSKNADDTATNFVATLINEDANSDSGIKKIKKYLSPTFDDADKERLAKSISIPSNIVSSTFSIYDTDKDSLDALSDLSKILAKEIKFEKIDSSVDTDTASITFRITIPKIDISSYTSSLAEFRNNLSSKNLSDAKLENKLLGEKFNLAKKHIKESSDVRSKKITINLHKLDNKWYVKFQ